MALYTVTLSHASNPDITGGYWEPPVDSGRKKRVGVASFNEASRVCMDYLKKNQIGAGNWTGGEVLCNGKIAGRISYNGRAWCPDGQEIDLKQE